MPISKIVFLDNYNLSIFSSVYKRSQDLILPLSSYKRNIENGFILIIPDYYITLISSDLSPTNKKISNKMIQLNLLGVLPENMIELNYGYIKTVNNNITIIAYSTEFREFCINYKQLIKNASIILTPAIIALLAVKDNFILENDDLIFYKSGLDILHFSGKITNLTNSANITKYTLDSDKHQQILKWMEQLPPLSQLKKTIFHNLILDPQKKAIYTSSSKQGHKIKPFITIIFLIFLTTLYYIKILPLQRDIKSTQDSITQIYSQIGINNSNTKPLDALQYKIKRLQDIEKISLNPIEIHNKLELAFNEDSTIESFNLDSNNLELKIITKNTKTFEKLSSNITRIFGLKFTIISTEIKDGKSKYDLSLNLNQIPSNNIMEP